MFEILRDLRPIEIQDSLISSLSFCLNPPFENPFPASLAISEEYKAFLRFSNGGVLFFDSHYGQWGLVLHGVDPFPLVYASGKTRMIPGLAAFDAEFHAGYQHVKDRAFTERYFAFASWLGDFDTMLFATDDPNASETVYVQQQYDSPKRISAQYPSFVAFLEDSFAHIGQKKWDSGKP